MQLLLVFIIIGFFPKEQSHAAHTVLPSHPSNYEVTGFCDKDTPACTQTADSTYKYWMTLGFGMMPASSQYRDVDYFSFHCNYSFSALGSFFKIGLLNQGDPMGSIDGVTGYLHHIADISIGKRFQSKWFQFAVFSGPSFIWGEKLKVSDSGARNIVDYQTLGLQADAQVLFRIADEIGIGLGLYGNLNLEQSVAGFTLEFTVGNGK